MHKPLVIAIVLLGASGCVAIPAAMRVAADRADETLAAAEFTLCRAITVGAWVRAYGADRAKAEAWQTLCQSDPRNLPVLPAGEQK